MALSVHLVALPIGNVGDLSSRAADSLQKADRIFCEDTRKLKEFLKRASLESSARFTALPGGSEHDFDWARCTRENAGDRLWVLVSDAGTPLVNDPGASLVEFCRSQGITLSAIPGACAPIAAWQWSGGFGLPFVFAGFAPKAKNPGAKDLDAFFAPAKSCSSFSYFDTRHQFDVTLRHLIEKGWGERSLYVAREITKPHEELIAGTVTECLERLEKRLKAEDALGEMTFLLQGDGNSGRGSVEVSLQTLVEIRKSSVKEAARKAAEITGLPSKDCYKAFVEEDRE